MKILAFYFIRKNYPFFIVEYDAGSEGIIYEALMLMHVLSILFLLRDYHKIMFDMLNIFINCDYMMIIIFPILMLYITLIDSACQIIH